MKTYFLSAIVFQILFANRLLGQPVTNNLVLWLKADVAVVTNSSGNITSWADQSGLAHHATQTNSGQCPTLINSAINGLPVARFNGANSWMNLSGQILSSNIHSIFCVVSYASTGTSHREIFSNWQGTNGYNSVYLGFINQNPIQARFTDYLSINGSGNVSVASNHCIITAVNGFTNTTVYQDRNLILSTNQPLPSTLILTSPYVIGRQGANNNNEYWTGDIAELLIYNTELTVPQRMLVWSYLENRYASLVSASITNADNSSVNIAWNTVVGKAYEVQSAPQLATDLWVDQNAPIPGSGLSTNISDATTGSSSKFYRVFSWP
jgi:hypothetical protein